MNEIEYLFGTGDGTVHTWTSVADLAIAESGVADGVRLDFDGDGIVDDAMWDTAGIGSADVAALDLDDDGILDHFYSDPTGLGTWNHHITGTASGPTGEYLDWIVRNGQSCVGTAPPDYRAAPQDPGAGSPGGRQLDPAMSPTHPTAGQHCAEQASHLSPEHAASSHDMTLDRRLNRDDGEPAEEPVLA